MKASLFLILAQLSFASRIWSQTPTPTPPSDYVVVEGNIPRPGLVQYTSGMKFLDAIGLAGGITQLANVKTIYLVRCGKKEKINVLSMRGDSPAQPVLQAWDIIYIPPAFF